MKKFVVGPAAALCVVLFGMLAVQAQDVQISEDSGKTINFVDAVYPKEAKVTGFEGIVVVRVKVDRLGRVSVKDAFGPNGPCANRDDRRVKLLRDAAIDAAKATVFKKSVTSREVTLKYEFSADQDYKKSAGAVQPLTIKAGTINGKAKYLPAPAYSQRALANRVTGSVTVNVVIDIDGNVKFAGALSGHSDLRDEAEIAACRAKFEPTILQGKPVEINGVIVYSFSR